MSNIRAAVIGAGHLGQYHAQKYHQIESVDLVGICDQDLARAQLIAKQNNTCVIDDYRDLAEQVDAVSIATPTDSHFEIAQFFLKQGKHVLVEKPITTTIEEASELIDLSNQHQAYLQVGHIERFNPCVNAVKPLLKQPRFIEATRLSTFKLRGLEVNVILDLMIHDIDLILAIVESKVKSISAIGSEVLTDQIDMANVRLEFENGTVANITANRISQQNKREIFIFQHDNYFKLDLNHKRLHHHFKSTEEIHPGYAKIDYQRQRFSESDALLEQIKYFINCIQNQTAPQVDGAAGKNALEIAIKITAMIHQQLEQSLE